MKVLKLLPHNQQAVDKTLAHFKAGNKKAAIIHPTGTGKSYCIAAIAQHFKNIAIVAPNKYVLEQIKNVCGKHLNITYFTYSKISRSKVIDSGFDLIVIDELHRMGGMKWEIGINNFLKANPQAKVLGTTATPIRFLDGGRDMAEDYFKGNIISKISLEDAMINGILPVPHYVVGFYTLDFMNELLIKEKRGTLEKKALKNRMSSIREKWNSSNGVAGIIKRHVSLDTKRAIIFFKNIKDLEDNKQEVENWFISAGFNVYKTYTVHSKCAKNLNDFEAEKYTGIKLLFCVNMLNEGIHVSGVDVVIFLRNTTSRNIWFQQMGRVLGCNKKKAVILDLVANSRNTVDVGYIRNIQKIYNSKTKSNKNKGISIEQFDITDETEDFIKIMNGIDLNPMSVRFNDLYDFGIKEKRKPDPILEEDMYKLLVDLYDGYYRRRYRDQNLLEKVKNLFDGLKFEIVTNLNNKDGS